MDVAFGERLRRARIKKGLTQFGLLAELSARGQSVSQGSYSRYENGQLPRSPEVVRALAEILQVDAEWLKPSVSVQQDFDRDPALASIVGTLNDNWDNLPATTRQLLERLIWLEIERAKLDDATSNVKGETN